MGLRFAYDVLAFTNHMYSISERERKERRERKKEREREIDEKWLVEKESRAG